jgi:hypothetical protein
MMAPDAIGPRAPKAAPGLRRALAMVAAIGCIAGAVAFAVAGPRPALGVATGGGLAFLNLWAFWWAGSRLLSTTGSKAPWVAVAIGKVLVLFAAVFLLLWGGVVGPLELALGYLAMPVGIALSYVLFQDPGLDSNRESA